MTLGIDPSWGRCFRSFEEFCEFRQPWGLGKPWPELRPFILAVCGGNQAQAAAVTSRAEGAPTHAAAASGQAEKGLKGFKPKVAETPGASAAPHTEKRKRTSFADNDYLAARIARDAPEVHARMKAGEFKSVRNAAISAGIVKPADPVKVAIRAFRKVPEARRHEVLSVDVRGIQTAIRRLTADEQGQLYAWLGKELER